MALREWNDKQVVLFDLDGTLTDPGIGITNSVMYALKKYGIDVSDRSELYKFIGPPLSKSFEKYYGFSESEAIKAVNVYREHFGLKGYFDFIAGSLMNGERTDKGEVIRWALKNLEERYGAEGTKAAVMVGDREHDVIGAKKNDIPVIGVLFGYGSKEELESVGADSLAESVSELYQLLAGEALLEV